MPARVLIVDDDERYADRLTRALARQGHEVARSYRVESALARVADFWPEVAVVDDALPDGDGLSLIETLARRAPDVGVVFSPAAPALALASEALARGALDFVPKDRALREHVIRVELAVERARAQRARARPTPADALALLGDSEAMQRLRGRLGELAGSDAPVTLVGEPGLFLGSVALALHRSSPRRHAPFVVAGAGDGPDEGDRARAQRGTLFVDELAALGPERAAALVAPGGPRVVMARRRDARDVPAAPRDPRGAQTLEVPPLRERGDDYALLAAQIAADRARVLDRPQPTLGADAVEAMGRHPFPGNLRELVSLVELALLREEGDVLGLDAFPSLPPARASEKDRRLTAIRAGHEVDERARIVGALHRSGGNVSAAARALGLSRYQVLRRIAKYGLR